MKWHAFDAGKGYRQLRPPLRKWVVVMLAPKDDEILDLGVKLKPEVPNLIASYPPGIAVGYRKDSGGDKSRPYFVIPGLGGEVTAWSDCLPDDFEPVRVKSNPQ